MNDKAYEIKQWVAVLLHFAVICFLLFPLCSPAPMSMSSASLFDINAKSQPTQASRDNLTALSQAFMDDVWRGIVPPVGRRSLPKDSDSEGPIQHQKRESSDPSLESSQEVKIFLEYLGEIQGNPASWQSPMRLSYGYLGTCYVESKLGTRNQCSKSSLHPRLSSAQIDAVSYVNSTKYFAATPDELKQAEANSSMVQELWGAKLDTSMLPDGWGPCPSLQLALLVLFIILLAGTAMPLTLYYIAQKNPMSKYSTQANTITEHLSIAYQKLHLVLIFLLLAAELAMTLVTRINVKQAIQPFNKANNALWLPSDIMLNTFASPIPKALADRVQSQTILYTNVGAGFSLYYTALACHLALWLVSLERYKDDSSRREVRIHFEANWTANAELLRTERMRKPGTTEDLGPETPPALKRQRLSHQRRKALAEAKAAATPSTREKWGSLGEKSPFEPGTRPLPDRLDLSADLFVMKKRQPRTPHGAWHSTTKLVPSPDTISPAAGPESINEYKIDADGDMSYSVPTLEDEFRVQMDPDSKSQKSYHAPSSFDPDSPPSDKDATDQSAERRKSVESSIREPPVPTLSLNPPRAGPSDSQRTLTINPPPSANSQTTFGTLHSPWAAESGEQTVQMEVLH